MLLVPRSGKPERLALGDDATFSLRGDIQPDTEAGAVFAGYGLQVPENKFDDLAGLDVKGKIVIGSGGVGQIYTQATQRGAVGYSALYPDKQPDEIPSSSIAAGSGKFIGDSGF